MFLESFSNGPGCLSNVFLITCKFPILKPINGSTSVFHGVLVLGGYQDVLSGPVALEVGLYAIPTADLLDAFA